MKKIILITFGFLLLAGTVSGQSKKEKQVADATEQLRKAMVDADKSGLEKLASDQLSYGHSGGHVEGKAEFVDKIVSGKSDFVSIELTDQTIAISGKTAVVRHSLAAKTNDGGKPGEVHLKILLIWQKEGSQWKLLARQAVKILK
ncbi:MAG: nuclear transport factor 2 family protein [Chitinophagales bacterium]|nr:nuclear transport factor 2 family protein [Chitinophagales bacterium]